jgi:hypothetical protein
MGALNCSPKGELSAKLTEGVNGLTAYPLVGLAATGSGDADA